MVNYSEAKIYKVLNSVDDGIYVGSTTQSLSKRMGKHRSNAKYRNTKFYQHMHDIGIDNFYIEWIEQYPCSTNDELHAREGEWIRQLGTLNQIVSGRTPRQYREENPDKIRETNRRYREQNGDKIREMNQQYRDQNRDKIKEQKQQYREQNRDKIREQSQQYREHNSSNICTCVCGSLVSKINMCKHIKTAKHKQFIETMSMTSKDAVDNADVSTTASDTGTDTDSFDLSSMD